MRRPRRRTPRFQPGDAMIPLSHLSHHALRVADVERSIRFYRDVVGIDLTERGPDGTAYMRRAPRPGALPIRIR